MKHAKIFCAQLKTSKNVGGKSQAMSGSQKFIFEEKFEYCKKWPKFVTNFINFSVFSIETLFYNMRTVIKR